MRFLPGRKLKRAERAAAESLAETFAPSEPSSPRVRAVSVCADVQPCALPMSVGKMHVLRRDGGGARDYTGFMYPSLARRRSDNFCRRILAALGKARRGAPGGSLGTVMPIPISPSALR